MGERELAAERNEADEEITRLRAINAELLNTMKAIYEATHDNDMSSIELMAKVAIAKAGG